MLPGSCTLEELAQSILVVGNKPLYEVAEHHPVDAWRVWSSEYPKNYTEKSEVCIILVDVER